MIELVSEASEPDQWEHAKTMKIHFTRESARLGIHGRNQ
jgi:hypothetical protein